MSNSRNNNSTSNVNTNSFQEGLVTDLHENFMGDKVWSHARNAVMNSHNGQIQFVQNEPSNYECVHIPYTPIGFIKILENKWVVFSTDNISSEIGIFDESECTYTKVVNASCLNFSTKYPVKGTFRELFDCTQAVYWTDGGYNPRRYLNLSKIPYTFTIEDDTCETKTFTNNLDCDGILVEKNIDVPCITVTRGVNGNLRNGVYQFAIAYTAEKNRLTDFYSITAPHKIWSHENHGFSINLQVDNLDREFDQYELAVVFTINGVTEYKTIGFYSTGNTRHNITAVNRPEYTALDLADISIPRAKYPYADDIESNDMYLLWSGVRTNADLNYQPQAMKIRSKYVVYQMPADAYKKGNQTVGYMRDEKYSFAIQWLRKNGEWSSAYHIPGRKPLASEIQNASGRDVIEVLSDIKPEDAIKVFQVENTAGQPAYKTIVGDYGVIGEGQMGYWESSELYPDNEDMFGDDHCNKIRHPLFPDDCKVPRYSENGTHINVLGVKFENVEHPKDESGNYASDVVGYRIVRGDRQGNETILAKGLFTNIRSYTENGREVIYSNYPYNDLSPDQYLSLNKTENKSGERNYVPLTGYSKDEFSFYSPETSFNRTALGDELRIYTEERAKVNGFFEEVYKHPRAKLLTEFDLYFALILGTLDGYLKTRGKKCITYVGPKSDTITIGAGVVVIPDAGVNIPSFGTFLNQSANTLTQACDDALSFTLSSDAKKFSQLTLTERAERIVRDLARVGAFAFFVLDTAQKVLDIILNASGWQQYAMQYNSHGFFTSHICADKDFKRRKIDYYQYVSDGLNTINNKVFNNYKREETVYLKLSDILNDPKTTDTTRNTISGFGVESNPLANISSTASAFYGAIKRPVQNQYGQLDSIHYLDTGHCVLTPNSILGQEELIYHTDSIFGGDVYITRMAIKRPQHMFSQFEHDVPDNFIYDYSAHRNIGHPRYWIDTTPYDISEFVTTSPTRSNTPKNKHNLDTRGNTGFDNITVVKNRYFYLFNSGVMDFFVESTYNMEWRDWKGDHSTFYSDRNSDLKTLFRSDRIEEREEFVYDESYFKPLNEYAIFQQQLDFNPSFQESCFTYNKNRVIYSIPSFKEQKGDNWLVYLAANFTDFPSADFGNLTAMKGVDNQRIMFLFDKAAPFITTGRDELQLDGSGRKITIGDAGLFARPPLPIATTDFYYASSQSKWAFMNTQYGAIYPSQRQGRVFQFAGNLNEISNRSMNWWFKKYEPSFLLGDFPNYLHKDNPLYGVGMQLAFDNTNEIIYIAKKDFRLKDTVRGSVVYNSTTDKFTLTTSSQEIFLHDTDYFEDASWTISYDPKSRIFISWHDWHPDWILNGERHFMTVKNNSIWKHNDRCDSYCNFYGIDYPFEIEPVSNNGQDVNILRSVEYQLEVGKYFNNCRDFHTILDDNFDKGIVSNAEQCSGLLKFNIQNKKDMSTFIDYPKYNYSNEYIDILYNKEEQKYRFNQFSDIVKDRGEFTHRNFPIWLTPANGYAKTLNSHAIDYQKTIQFQKKFRNTWHKILLRKDAPGDRKMIIKFLNTKQVQSNR